MWCWGPSGELGLFGGGGRHGRSAEEEGGARRGRRLRRALARVGDRHHRHGGPRARTSAGPAARRGADPRSKWDASSIAMCPAVRGGVIVPNREVPFEDGMKFGRGYDRLTGDVKISAAVEFPSATPPPGAGQLVTADCVIVQTVEMLHKALGISVDAGGSYMGFSGSAKADYAK